MIPEEILTKYHMSSLQQWLDDLMPDSELREKEITLNYYKKFLDNTDYEMIKAFECLFAEPSKFVTNIITLYKQYSDIIKGRVFARTEADKIKQEFNF